MADSGEHTPVTLLAGFLGSDKTTLLNRILSERHGEAIAVLVNEFGEVGIDGRLVVGASEDVIELQNGCVCCTVRGDLQRSLTGLLRRRRRRLFRRAPFERVVIEASGLASPGPVAQTLVLVPELEQELRLDGVVTLAHAALIGRQLERHPEAADQLGYADRIVLNHRDRCGPGGLAAARRAVTAINSTAEVLEATRADVPIAELLALRSLEPGAWRLAGGAAAAEHGTHEHATGVGTVVLTTREELDLFRLKLWLQFVAARRGQELLRMKGLFRCRDHGPAVVVQAVYQWLELGPGPGEPPEESVLVLIGRDLDRDELERGFAACRAAG